MVGGKSGIGWVCAIEETKVGGDKVKGAGIGRGFILQEVSRDGGVINVRV